MSEEKEVVVKEPKIRFKKDGVTPFAVAEKLPARITSVKQHIIAQLDKQLLYYAAAISLSGNATIEVIGGMNGIEKYFTDIIHAIYFGEVAEGVSKAKVPYRYELKADPDLIEAIYELLPEDLKVVIKEDSGPVKKQSVIGSFFEMIVSGAATRDFFVKNGGLKPRQIAFLDKMLAEREAGVAPENVSQCDDEGNEV